MHNSFHSLIVINVSGLVQEKTNGTEEGTEILKEGKKARFKVIPEKQKKGGF